MRHRGSAKPKANSPAQDLESKRKVKPQSGPRTFISAGSSFGKWTTLEPTTRNRDKPLCRCECGIERNVFISTLLAGQSTFCGKHTRHPDLKRSVRFTTHGENSGGKKTKEYQAWCHVKARCLNSKNHAFPHYGGRGIKMAPEWQDSYERFLVDVGRAPGPEYTLERMDNDGNYEPGNVRWATRAEQNANKRPWASASLKACLQIAALKNPSTLDDARKIAKSITAMRSPEKNSKLATSHAKALEAARNVDLESLRGHDRQDHSKQSAEWRDGYVAGYGAGYQAGRKRGARGDS